MPTKPSYVINRSSVKKVLSVVDKGLTCGLGNNTPGEMCVEAAVCYAFGWPHSDNPICVHGWVRDFKITLNDCGWTSPQSRALGLRRVAIAQLGSEDINRRTWLRATAKAILLTVLLPSLDDVAIPMKHIAQVSAAVAVVKKSTTAKHVRDLIMALHSVASVRVVLSGSNFFRDASAIANALGANGRVFHLNPLVSSSVFEIQTPKYDTYLTQLAECVVTGLKAAGAKGVKFLYLTEK